MKLNWNFQRGRDTQSKKPSVGEVWIFPVTTQLLFAVMNSIFCYIYKDVQPFSQISFTVYKINSSTKKCHTKCH